MTPEQKQRVEQIREQQNKHAALFDASDSYKIVQRSEIRIMLNSIDFLLSLVKSQHDPDAERVAIAGIQEGLRQRDELAANRMRSACVEKVKSLPTDYRDDRRPAMTADSFKRLVIKELKSVSIQEQEK